MVLIFFYQETYVHRTSFKGRVTEPHICQKEQCKASNSMTLVHNRCRYLYSSFSPFLLDIMLNWFAVLTILFNIYCSQTRFSDKQIIKLQETPDEIPEGGTPHTVSVVMHDRLVDAGKPGDRVEVGV